MTDSMYRIALEHAIELAIAYDGDGRIVYANRAAEENLSYETGMIGKSIEDVISGISDCQVSLKEDGEDLEMMAYRENHTCFPVKGRIVRADEDTYLCLACNETDRSYLERVANQLGQEAEAAEKIKNEFVANVTHELRTPVNGILGNTRELLEKEKDKDKLNNLRLIEHECKDMNALINSILDFSKLEAGKFTLEPREFNFREMLDYVRANHSPMILEKGLDFFVAVSPEVPDIVIGDELRIVQVLNNLLSNACKFTSVGKIAVEVVKTAQVNNRAELFFLVVDSGIGIAEENIDKLFKSFTQVDASISRRFGGTGLGLNISKQLIELMDGKIHVQSEYGKGTMFSFNIWVELPREECEKGEETGTSQASYRMPDLNEAFSDDKVWKYGTKENREEIEKKMSKLILSVEMENWEKAEMFANTLKQLTEQAPREVKTAALRMKMSVQKGNLEKVTDAYETFREEFLKDAGGEGSSRGNGE